MEKIKIVIVEDDPAYIEVLEQVLSRDPKLEVVQTFVSSIEFLAAIQKLEVQMVFLDIRMPKCSGLECIDDVKEFLPEARIVMLTLYDDDDYILKAFEEGADGYLLKDSKPGRILEAIDDALTGGAPMSPSIARRIISMLDQLNQNGEKERIEKEARLRRILTDREYEILELLAEGKTKETIGKQLFISVNTVKTHIRHVYDKLDAHNKAEVIQRLP